MGNEGAIGREGARGTKGREAGRERKKRSGRSGLIIKWKIVHKNRGEMLEGRK